MPPPSRAKIEISDAPKAKPSSGFSDSESTLAPPPLTYQKNAPTPIRPRPTTSMPVMAPPLKATSSAGPMPLVAACAVRTLARTEMFMPMKPQAPERTAPSTKPAAVVWSRKKKISKASTTPTRAIVLYWRAR